MQRIFDTYVGAQRTHRIENSLTYSKNKVLQKATLVVQSEVDQCVEHIMKEKNINPEKDVRYAVFPAFSFVLHPHSVNCSDHTQL